jgi:ankyrin repeat protein
MRNGDTVLHVAAAYNSLESMIILTNFGGMELFVQKNRYGLRAIDIAQKMRNYECFEALQKLERNVSYQNALLEREVQAMDSVRPSKSYRLPTGADMGYRGAGANYP